MKSSGSVRRFYRSGRSGLGLASHSAKLRRRACFETLESRHLLSITLPALANQTVLAGAPLSVALDASDTDNVVNYTVTVTDSQLANSTVSNPQLTAAIPHGNPSLRMVVDDVDDNIHGEMVFQLAKDLAPETVDQIMALASTGFYDGLTFHRVIKDFMIQGGDPNGNGTGGPESEFDDEFNTALQFTSGGVLAMANSGPDSNGSQFFITSAPYRGGDFRYTIVGFLTHGNDILQQISNIPVHANSRGELSVPNHTVTLTDVSVFTDTQDAVLRISAPIGTTGTATVTVAATDSVTQESMTKTFQVSVAADGNNDRPLLGAIDPIPLTPGTPFSFDIPATDVEGDAIFYDAYVAPNNADPRLSLTVDSSTGHVTLTPAAGASGVFTVIVAVKASNASSLDTIAWDSQAVPVYISPNSPSSISLMPASDSGASNSDNVTSFNNTAGQTLQFQVDGVLAGAVVELFADGVSIGQRTATGTSVIVVTTGATTLIDGNRAITSRQTLANQPVNVGNLDTTTNLVSQLSAPLSIRVDTTPVQFNFAEATTAVLNVAYHCQVMATDIPASGVTYALLSSPTGMTIDAATGQITWTPIAGQEPSASVSIRATDAAGNAADHQYTINVLSSNSAPVLAPASPSVGTTDEETSITIDLATLINNGEGTTGISDLDDGATIGGVAIIGATGHGTWEYSLDGTTFVPAGTISASSALLLAHDAVLRYTPDGQNAESAGITYRAWDTTGGANGLRADLSQNDAIGGATAFSEASDTASLTITVSNTAPVLTPFALPPGSDPRLGRTTPSVPKTIALAALIGDTIADSDPNAVVGGIALTAVTGKGTWAYSTDGGTTFTDVGAVSQSSALLLPKPTVLRYTPDGTSEEMPTITYRAWDATDGQAGDKLNTSPNGGSSAFSTATDSAGLLVRRISISGLVYVDANDDGNYMTSSGQSHLVLPGVVVRLFLKDAQGSWTEVAGKSPVMTGANGSYHFDGLAAGTYRVEEVQPLRYLDGKETLGTVYSGKSLPPAPRGTAGADRFEITLGVGDQGSNYNFGERGLRPELISLAYFMASAPQGAELITMSNSAPVIDVSSGTPTDPTPNFVTGGSPVAIVPSATIADADSPMLAWLTATIGNLRDGASEKLSVTTTGTSITSSYAEGLLTLSGVADRAVYQQVLRSLTYTDTASSPTLDSRSIRIVANDGIASSEPATVAVSFAAAVDAALESGL